MNEKLRFRSAQWLPLSFDGWAVAAATLFIVLIVVGTLPRFPW